MIEVDRVIDVGIEDALLGMLHVARGDGFSPGSALAQ